MRSRRKRGAGRPAAKSVVTPAPRFPWLLCGLAVLLAALPYLGSLGNAFAYDDLATIVGNTSIRHPVAWRSVFAYALFRPAVNASYAIDSFFWGLDPFGFHLTNLLLHAANTGLLFLLAWCAVRDGAKARASDPQPRWAALPAFLFAVHPLQVEAVAYASARSELLCALFSLLALLAFRRAAASGRLRWLVPALVAMLLGLACKEVAAMLPLLAWAYDRLFQPQDPGVRRRQLVLYLPPLVVVAAVGCVRLAIYFGREAAGASSFVGRNLLLQIKVLWHYLALLVLPVGQSVVHEFREVGSAFEPGVLAAELGLAGLLFVAWRLRRREPRITFGILWLLLILLPSSSIVPMAEPMAEHRMYLASAGVFLAFAGLAASLAARFAGPASMRVAGAATVVVILALVAATVARARVWRDPVTLWSDAAIKAPHTYAVHYALGESLRDRGDCPAAIVEYQRAIERVPDQPDAWTNLGICRAETGALAEAEAAFLRGLALDPSRAGLHYNLGMVARLRGDAAAAHQHFLDAVKVDPTHEKAQRALSAGY
ncbi:MAG: tetratricopeptide repeat protein [Polyangia bacterium]